MDVCKFTERQQRWLRSYQKTCCEIHLPRFIFEWIEVNNLFVNKMGFIPIDAVLDVQLSVCISTPKDKTGKGLKAPKGYRFEIVDGRMVRASWKGDYYAAKYMISREDHPRWGDAEIEIDGAPFLHHAPLRHHRQTFRNTADRGGVNTRVTLRKNTQPDTWLSHNSLENNAGERDLCISEDNWWGVVPQLIGFTEQETLIIKNMELLWPLANSGDRNHLMLAKMMEYAWESKRFSYH